MGKQAPYYTHEDSGGNWTNKPKQPPAHKQTGALTLNTVTVNLLHSVMITQSIGIMDETIEKTVYCIESGLFVLLKTISVCEIGLASLIVAA